MHLEILFVGKTGGGRGLGGRPLTMRQRRKTPGVEPRWPDLIDSARV